MSEWDDKLRINQQAYLFRLRIRARSTSTMAAIATPSQLWIVFDRERRQTCLFFFLPMGVNRKERSPREFHQDQNFPLSHGTKLRASVTCDTASDLGRQPLNGELYKVFECQHSDYIVCTSKSQMVNTNRKNSGHSQWRHCDQLAAQYNTWRKIWFKGITFLSKNTNWWAIIRPI